VLKVIRAKFHGIQVTAADLNYHGSITLDPVQCTLAGIFPLEFVDIWNKHFRRAPVDLRHLWRGWLPLLRAERCGCAHMSGRR